MTEYYRYTGERVIDCIFLVNIGVMMLIGAKVTGIMIIALGIYKLVYAITYSGK